MDSTVALEPEQEAKCSSEREHDAERFLLEAAIYGLPLEAVSYTLNIEEDRQGHVWAWKIMRCGCVFVSAEVRL